MNIQAQQEYKLAQERRVFLAAARLDELTPRELWEALDKIVRYGHISQLLLKWWREDGLLLRYGSGTWHEGYVFSKVDRRFWGHRAVYKWNE